MATNVNYGAWSALPQAITQGLGAFAQAKDAKRRAQQEELANKVNEAQLEELTPSFPVSEFDPTAPPDLMQTRKERLATWGETAKKKAAVGPDGKPILDPKTSFEREDKLRDEYQKSSKDFAQQVAALGRIEQSVKTPSAAGDLALIFNYMKMLDPGSTVREGEFANAQNSAGIPDQIRNAYNRAISGERLNPNQRMDFYRSARRTFAGALGTQGQTRKQYQELSGRYGISPQNVLVDPADPRWFEKGGFNPEDISGLGMSQVDQAATFDPASEAEKIRQRRQALQGR